MPKIIAISDSHELHSNIKLPDGDILIHCGDWTNQGTSHAIVKFLEWFKDQPHKQKIFIAGNHEVSLDNANKEFSLSLISKYITKDFQYLQNSSIVINGLKFYGSPATPYFYDWAFNFKRGTEIAKEWAKIPDDVNVLITHGPPHGTLDLVENNLSNKGRDLHQGCEELAKKIKTLTNLKAHVFGHLHTDGGKQTVINNVVYANAAICTEQYKPLNSPIEINL